MRFETRLAWRHLVHSGKQTLLTVVAVAIASMVVLFVQVTIAGMQARLRRTLISSLSHVTIKPLDTLPATLAMQEKIAPADPNLLFVSDQQPRLQQRTDIDQWRGLIDRIGRLPGVRVAAPAVNGSAFVTRGSKRYAVSVTGADPALQEQVSPLQKDMLVGRWLGLAPDEVVVGVKLANEMRLKLGDHVVLQSAEGVSQGFTVAGVFYVGTTADLNQVYMNLRAAQSLMATGRDVSIVQVKLEDAFRADEVARRLAAALPYRVDTWMGDSAAILNQLTSMNVISTFLTSFVLLASSVAVSAIMIVSVLQKNRQIGILKSMGARDRQILAVFTLEGLGVAIAGALSGVALAIVALNTIGKMSQPSPFGGRADAVVEVVYDPPRMALLVAVVIAATVIAAVFPARQAARLNPVEVIRG